METMDLETDVCRSRDLSLHLVPYKLKVQRIVGNDDCDDNDPQFDPEALHMCTKLSGVAAQYTRFDFYQRNICNWA